jgi:hypothetical protein
MAIKNLSALESALGLPAGEFKKMYDDTEEKEIPLTDIEIMKKADFETRLKNERTTEFAKGKTAGIEIGTKEIVKAFGVEIEKDLPGDKVAEKIKDHIITAAKLPAEPKIKELENDKKILASKLAEKETEITTLQTGFKQKESGMKIDGFVREKMPVKGMVLDPNRLSLLFKTDFNPKLDEDGKTIVFHKDGVVMKNPKTMNPMTIDEILPEWQKTFEGKAGGGKGGSDELGTGGANDMDAFIEEMKQKGIKPNTPDFNKERRERFATKK